MPNTVQVLHKWLAKGVESSRFTDNFIKNSFRCAKRAQKDLEHPKSALKTSRLAARVTKNFYEVCSNSPCCMRITMPYVINYLLVINNLNQVPAILEDHRKTPTPQSLWTLIHINEHFN